MSSYENYNDVSEHYDSTRKALGVDYYLGALHVHHGLPLSDLHVLDAGCGTGNYSRALLDAGIGKLSALDASEGMLKVARAKCAPEIASGRAVTFQQHYLPEIPFQDKGFDVVMINQVLHHLQPQSPGGSKLDAIEKALSEAARVLKPGGIIIINTCLPQQILRGYWWYALIPAAADRMANNYPSLQFFKNNLTDTGFRDIHVSVPLDQLYDTLKYHDGECLLQKSWRATDSFWAHSTDDEIADMEICVKRMLINGTFKAFAEENDKEKYSVGQYAILYAKKAE